MQVRRYQLTVTFADTGQKVGFTVLANDEMNRGAVAAFVEREIRGITLSIDEDAPQSIGRAHEGVITQLAQIVSEYRPELLIGAVPDPDDERINNLERSVGMQGRALERLGGTMEKILGLLEERQQPSTQFAAPLVGVVPPTSPMPAQYAQPQPIAAGVQQYDAPSPVVAQQQALAMQKGFPLVGTPSQVAGDPTLPTNPNARGSGRTPEMLSGQMAMTGRDPRSQILTYSGKVDEKGEAVFDTVPLGRVGESLRTGTQKSDIEVPYGAR